MEVARAGHAHELLQSLGRKPCGGARRPLHQFAESRLRAEIEGETHTSHQRLEVGAFLEKIRLNIQRPIRRGAQQAHVPAADGPHEARRDGE